MIHRWLVLLLPPVAILAVDPVAFDYHAAKYAALMAGAVLCLIAARRCSWTTLSLALWIFVAVRGLMLIDSPMPGRSIRWWGALVALVFVHQSGAGRRWLRRRAPAVLGALLGVLSVWALAQYATGARQAQATFANRNFLGAGLAMLLPFALATRWSPRGRGLLVGLGLLGLLATRSRGGALAAAAALALWFAWTRPRLRLPLLVGAPVAVVALGLALGETNTVKVRLAWYGAAARMGLEHPMRGHGAGGFEREYPPVRTIEEHRISGGARVHAVHNDYLESFAEGGLPGLAAHLLLLVLAARAARRHRVAACSLLAFAAASLVDLPLRDPSLLALAFLSLSLVARRRRLRVWYGLPGLVVVMLLVPDSIHHWWADRYFGRYLEEGRNPVLLEQALAMERRHEEALLERGEDGDLRLLLELEPHHAGARYNATEHLLEEEAIDRLQEILLRHDPHHTLTRVRLAALLMKRDHVAAASVLSGAIDADPRPWRPYAMLAHIQREAGHLEQAERFLRRAEARSDSVEVRHERLRLEIGRKGAIEDAARRLPPGEVLGLLWRAFARAAAVEAEHPRPRVEREEGESDADFARRVQRRQEDWADEVARRARDDYREAAALARALKPSAAHLRLVARAERGLRNFEAADRAEGHALFRETLRALADGDRDRAAERFKRALRTYPGLLEDAAIPAAIRLFIEGRPEAREAARELFRHHAPFLDAVDRDS